MHPKEWRESAKLSQGEVAKKLTTVIKPVKPYRQSHVSGWENGAMADAVVGDAYRTISQGQVRGADFGKPLTKETDNGER